MKRISTLLSAFLLSVSLAACTGTQTTEETEEEPEETNTAEVTTNLPKIDSTQWSWNSDDDVYYQS